MKGSEAVNTEDELAQEDGVGSLPGKQEAALRALLTHPTMKEAALAAGISEPTLWRYTKDAEFARRLREAQRGAVSHAVLRLQSAAGDAVRTLESVMNDDAAVAGPRITAARTILDMAVRLCRTEELEARIEELERFIERKQEEDAFDRAQRLRSGEEEGV